MEICRSGRSKLSADFRIGVDVMTTETTCLSSIWQTDEEIKEFYRIHGRTSAYKELKPGKVAYYDGVVEVNLSEIRPMIAMPFHPSNTYAIDELNQNLDEILAECGEACKSISGRSRRLYPERIKSVTENSMWIRESSLVVQVVDLRISVQQRIS